MILEHQSENKKALVAIFAVLLLIGVIILVWFQVVEQQDAIDLESLKYVSVVDWPPQVQLLDEPFSCAEAGEEFARAGRTERKVIDKQEYCVTKVSEGAAGSTYTMYAYSYPQGNQTVILTFSLRFIQCGNFDKSQQKECEIERAAFNPDRLLHMIRI